MKKIVVVMQDHESGMYLRRAIVATYEGEESPALPLPPDLIIQHVPVPVELENEQFILADIDENDVVSLRLPNPGELPDA